MTTLRTQKQPRLQDSQYKQPSTKRERTTLRKWLSLKGLLMGLLLSSVLITSGCGLNSKQPPQAPQEVYSVSPQLMVKPNLTSQLVSALSE